MLQKIFMFSTTYFPYKPESEPMTQAQARSVLMPEQLPNLGWEHRFHPG
jgi:hypothetical protein